MIHMKDWKTSHVAEYLILNLCETNMRKAHDFKGSKWLVYKICKTSTRYPTVDYDFMSLLSELVEELSVRNMSNWYGMYGSVCYESIYDDTSSSNIMGKLSVFQTMFVTVKYM